MLSIKQNNWKKTEIFFLVLIFAVLFINLFVLKDKFLVVVQAFFGIMYTFLAGKGNPKCYLFGVSGSLIYSWLSYCHAFWGNLLLYMFYYVPMQVLGFFKWNKNLKQGQNEIVKTKLSKKTFCILLLITTAVSFVMAYILYRTGDSNPIIDSITTVFSVAGMYLTVKRCIEQWFIWFLVNALSSLMWINVVLNGGKVYSTVFMWIIYTILSVYFYFSWRRELSLNK